MVELSEAGDAVAGYKGVWDAFKQGYKDARNRRAAIEWKYAGNGKWKGKKPDGTTVTRDGDKNSPPDQNQGQEPEKTTGDVNDNRAKPNETPDERKARFDKSRADRADRREVRRKGHEEFKKKMQDLRDKTQAELDAEEAEDEDGDDDNGRQEPKLNGPATTKPDGTPYDDVDTPAPNDNTDAPAGIHGSMSTSDPQYTADPKSLNLVDINGVEVPQGRVDTLRASFNGYVSSYFKTYPQKPSLDTKILTTREDAVILGNAFNEGGDTLLKLRSELNQRFLQTGKVKPDDVKKWVAAAVAVANGKTRDNSLSRAIRKESAFFSGVIFINGNFKVDVPTFAKRLSDKLNATEEGRKPDAAALINTVLTVLAGDMKTTAREIKKDASDLPGLTSIYPRLKGRKTVPDSRA